MNTHSHATPKVFMFRCEWVFTLDKNQRSRCIRIGVHDGCEYATIINGQVSVDNRNDEWFYFLGGIPIYSHQADNKRLFRLHTSQLINTGSCRSIDIITTFGVSKSSVMRSLRQLREKGADSFFEPRPTRKGGPLFTLEVLQQAQEYLDQGMTPNEAAKELGIRADTFRKAISDGRLKKSLPHQ